MTDTAAQEAPAEAGTGELLALTDEELIVLGVTPDQIGVLPFWDSLTEDEQNMGRRTAFRGLIARGLISLPSPDAVAAYQAAGPDAELEVEMRADLDALLTLRSGAPGVIAIARTAALGQDFTYAHVVGSSALIENLAAEGIHGFAVIQGDGMADDIAGVVLHPQAADGAGESYSFTPDDTEAELPAGLVATLGDAYLRSDVILRTPGDTHPPMLGVFSGPGGTWLARAEGAASGAVTAGPVTVAQAREVIADLVRRAQAAGEAGAA